MQPTQLYIYEFIGDKKKRKKKEKLLTTKKYILFMVEV